MAKVGVFCPPHLRGLGGKNVTFCPPYSKGLGANFQVLPPTWGANRSIFEKILRNQIPDYRFSFRKSHFRFQNWQNFRLRPLVLSYQIPQLFACGAFDFYVCFDRFAGFICPPYLRGLGGQIFCCPPYLRGLGGKRKSCCPPGLGGKCPALI